MRPDGGGLDDRLLEGFVGNSPEFRHAVTLLRRFAPLSAPMLITGETGTGKEFAARAAHYLSPRRNAPLIPVNCRALPDTLVESELFGHARGAFTDANRARPGLIREAEGGTLFLDEIEALSPRAQVSLLRFLQDAKYRSVGDEHAYVANIRVVAASNVDLQELVRAGALRSDLLFRLDVLTITLPPLRKRLEDLELLIAHLLLKAACLGGGIPKQVSADAFRLLRAYSWPGNVRELEHVLLRAHLLCTGTCIDVDDLVSSSPTLSDGHEERGGKLDRINLREQKDRAVREVECRFVKQALAQAHGNISEAARLCHMDRAAFSRMAKKYRQEAHHHSQDAAFVEVNRTGFRGGLLA